VLGKKALNKSCIGANELPKGNTMKKSIAILLILVFAGFGLFAAVENNNKDANIKVYTNVDEFSAFGVSFDKVTGNGFLSIANFQKEVSPTIDNNVKMLELFDYVDIGFLSGINNTTNVVYLDITIDKLVSDNGDVVGMLVSPEKEIIDPSKNNKFGTLQNSVISVKEAEKGAAALAPAGKYETTITIALGSA